MRGQINTKTSSMLTDVRPFHYFFGTAILFGFIFSILSDVPSHLSFYIQFAIWAAQAIIPVFLLIYSHVFLHKFDWYLYSNVGIKLFISGFLGSTLFVPVALVLNVMWETHIWQWQSIELLYVLLDEAGGIVPMLTLYWIGVNSLWVFAFRFVSNKKLKRNKLYTHATFDQPLNKEASCKQPEFFDWVKEDVRGEILFLKTELHYLMVATSKGKDLILFNIKNAVKEMSKHKGVLIDDSLWVSKRWIRNCITEKNHATLVLKDGSRFTVSLEQVAEL